MSYSLQMLVNVVNVAAAQSPYTIQDNTPGNTVFIIDSTNSTTINLPGVANVPKGIIYHLKRTGAAVNISIDGNSSETIDGSATKNISGTYDCWSIVSDGSEWWTIGYGLT